MTVQSTPRVPQTHNRIFWLIFVVVLAILLAFFGTYWAMNYKEAFTATRFIRPTRNMSYDLRGDDNLRIPRRRFIFNNSEIGA